MSTMSTTSGSTSATSITVKDQHSYWPLPHDEEERFKTVLAFKVLDTEEDPVLQSLCVLARTLTGTCFAGVSVMDRDRLWYKAVSFGDVPHGFQQPRRMGFCHWALLAPNPEVTVVPDMTKDLRMQHLPVVTGPPNIRFYAGAPLIASNGYRLGTFCLADMAPVNLTAEQYNLLTGFAEMALRELERDHHAALTQRRHEHMLRTANCFKSGVLLCDVAEPSWPILFANAAWTGLTGKQIAADADGKGQGFWDLYEMADKREGTPDQAFARLLERHENFTLNIRPRSHDGTQDAEAFAVNLRPACKETVDDQTPRIGVPSHIPSGLDNRSSNIWFASLPQTEDGQRVSKDLGSARNTRSLPTAPSVSSRGGSLPGTAVSSVLPSQSGATSYESLRKQLKAGADKGLVGSEASPVTTASELVLGVLVGAGRSGQVFRGQWHGAPVAVKVINISHSECIRMDAFNSWVPPEAAMAVSLSHPHLVRTYKFVLPAPDERMFQAGPFRPLLQHQTAALQTESIEQQEKESSPIDKSSLAEAWLVMEFCNRGTMRDAIDRGWFRKASGDRPNLNLVLASAWEIAAGLAHLHSLDVIHSDICADNINLVASNSSAGFACKIGDFGLSLITQGQAQVPPRQNSSWACAAPEMIASGRLSRGADIFGFGMVLWEMVTGEHAWGGLPYGQIVKLVVRQKQQPPLPSDTPRLLRVLISKCLAYDPNKRPSARKVMDSLDKLRVTVQAESLSLDPKEAAAAGCFGGKSKSRRPSTDGGSTSGSFTSNGDPAFRRPSWFSRSTSGLFGRKSFSSNDSSVQGKTRV